MSAKISPDKDLGAKARDPIGATHTLMRFQLENFRFAFCGEVANNSVHPELFCRNLSEKEVKNVVWTKEEGCNMPERIVVGLCSAAIMPVVPIALPFTLLYDGANALLGAVRRR